MKVVPLPFDLATHARVDTVSFETKYQHPVLDIGSSYTHLKHEVKIWLKDNCVYYRFDIDAQIGCYMLEFKSEHDAMLFKLRWL